MKKSNKSIASLAAAGLFAGLIAVVGATTAQATDVKCNVIGMNSNPGGNAYASGCRHSGTGENTRLWGQCKFSPFNVYSPTRIGSFTNTSFSTSTCAFGVNKAQIQHNF